MMEPKNLYNNKYFKLAYIGAGPSTMFSLLELIKKGYKGEIIVIEKGKKIRDRNKNKDIVNGVFGAGCFSDSKLSSGLNVGGDIPNLTKEELDKYSNYLLSLINEFKDTPDLNWDFTTPYDTKDSTLSWDTHNTCHIGTEEGQKIYSKIEDYINNQDNITLLTEEEATNIIEDPYYPGSYIIELENNSFYNRIYSNKVILATGQKSILPTKIVENFNLKSKSRPLQLGIRVEDKINKEYEEIIKSNYDFKFVKSYDYTNSTVRVRTFCCNSGNAHICAENNSEGFICFNGHSYKTPDPKNHTVNYGIICEVTYKDAFKGFKLDTKEKQINLMKSVNNLPTWEEDNFDNKKVSPKRKLLTELDVLKNVYPVEVLNSLKDFIKHLNKLVPLNEARFLYPEIKLSGLIPNINYNSFETQQENLYIIGDCCISRGIVKSAITGIKFADNLIEEEKC